MVKAELSKDGKKLIVTADVDSQGKVSKTGKSVVVASTNGNLRTSLEVAGKPVTIGLNAFIPA